MTNGRSLRIALLVWAGVPTSALTQNADRSNAVAALEAGQSLRLDVAQMGRIEGRFLNADQGTLTLDRDGAPTEFQLGDIERNLSTTMGHSWGLIRERFPVWRGMGWED